MTQENLDTAQIRVIPKCAKGMFSSATGQSAERRYRSSSHFRTSIEAIICLTVNLTHHSAGARQEVTANGDYLKDLGQSHTTPVTSTLIWHLTYCSNHSINISTSIQSINQYD